MIRVPVLIIKHLYSEASDLEDTVSYLFGGQSNTLMYKIKTNKDYYYYFIYLIVGKPT